jgi:hypothetical protein
VVDGIACASLKSSTTAANGVKVKPQAKRYILKFIIVHDSALGIIFVDPK